MIQVSRSISQIWQTKFNSIFLSLTFSFFVLLFIVFSNYTYFCFSLKGTKTPLLKEVQFNNIIFMCSKNLNNFDIESAINFAYNKKEFSNFSVCKYFEIFNNKPQIFKKNSCYSHLNLFFGLYNNLYFNLQFSHHKINNHFNIFTENDISYKPVDQYLCSQICIYDGTLDLQYLNSNSTVKNNFIPYKNDKSNEIQRYLDLNEIQLKKTILKAFDL